MPALGLVLGAAGCGPGEGDSADSTPPGSDGSQDGSGEQNGGGQGSGGQDSGGTTSSTGGGSQGPSASGTGGLGSDSPPPLPAECEEAAQPFELQVIPVGGDLAPTSPGGGFFSSLQSFLPVAVGADGQLYVGLNDPDGAVIADMSGSLLSVAGARMGGMAATDDGFAALLFDQRSARVARYSATGQPLFTTHLYNSPNLDDVGTKGEAGTSRFGYLSATDELVAYFGHTQRYDDGVRHQGGYLATVDDEGEENRLSGWFGSHNLDQRLWTDGNDAAVLGLGDAYPIGIFFSHLSGNPQTRVVYRLAAAGNGTANGQLGGLVDVGDELVAPFLTNLSVSPDLDAGEWPNINESISNQIREGANNQTDMGLLRLPKTGAIPAAADVPTVWLDPDLTEGARLDRLKSARYGAGNLILLLWSEATGSGNNASRSYFTMVVDPTGTVCQSKTPLDGAYSLAGGDDLVRAPDGTILWANNAGGSLSVIRLVPGTP